MGRVAMGLGVAVFVLGLGGAALAADNTPPEGFTALFNGKDLTNWATPETLAEAEKHWQIVDGVLEYDGKWRDLKTAKEYGNFELWVDWKIPPNGDSGIYIRDKPQVQIWQNKVGSGGLYNNRKNPSNPLAVADNPPGEWNTFKITIVDDVVTVYLNGKLVVDKTILENYPTYDSKLPATGHIWLQHHGSKLWFKNIYIKELPPTPAAAPEK
jgi:hypothetical protein